MIKILDCRSNNYQSKLNTLLFKRQSGVKKNTNIVKKIISDVRKNGDKALIKYEKRLSKNTEITSSKKKIAKSIKSLNPKVKKAIDFAFNRIFKFHSKQKVKNIFYKDKLQSRNAFINLIFLNVYHAREADKKSKLANRFSCRTWILIYY